MSVTYKLDKSGEPFEFETFPLIRQEYAKIISEINTDYRKYEGKPIGLHYSCGINGTYYLYYFENRGFDDYNIYMRLPV